MLCFLFICCGTKKSQKQNDPDYLPSYSSYIEKTGKPQKFEPDLVPDEKTAIKVANAIWDSRYGNSTVVRDLPYTVTLEENKVWFVKTNLPKGYVGQILFIKINKYDGKILYVWSEG